MGVCHCGMMVRQYHSPSPRGPLHQPDAEIAERRVQRRNDEFDDINVPDDFGSPVCGAVNTDLGVIVDLITAVNRILQFQNAFFDLLRQRRFLIFMIIE